jgi:HlyD family secretion protein
MRSSKRSVTVVRFFGALVVGAGAVLLMIANLKPRSVTVETALVECGPLTVTVDEEGRTRVRDRFVVSAPVTGRLWRIKLKEGDIVERGAVLATMSPIPIDTRTLAEEQARLDAAEAEKRAADASVERARAALEQARRERQRAAELASRGVRPVQDRERAEFEEKICASEVEAAAFAAKAASFQVEAARAALISADPTGQKRNHAPDAGPARSAETAVRSPIRGRVLRLIERSERVIAAGAPLLELADPSALEVVLDVLSSDAVKVRSGAKMLIENWGGGSTLRGRVRLVEPSGFTKLSALGVEEQRVHVVGDLVDTGATLGDGYRVEARIVVWEGTDILKVPSSALFRYGSDWNVFVVENRRAVRRLVQIDHRNAVEAEVLKGLREGEMVVIHPSEQLDDGVRVQVR